MVTILAVNDITRGNDVRSDLEGRLPIVYNGRSVEEWYRAYCDETAKTRKLIEVLESIVKHQDVVGGSMAKHSATRHIAAKAIYEATGRMV